MGPELHYALLQARDSRRRTAYCVDVDAVTHSFLRCAGLRMGAVQAPIVLLARKENVDAPSVLCLTMTTTTTAICCYAVGGRS